MRGETKHRFAFHLGINELSSVITSSFALVMFSYLLPTRRLRLTHASTGGSGAVVPRRILLNGFRKQSCSFLSNKWLRISICKTDLKVTTATNAGHKSRRGWATQHCTGTSLRVMSFHSPRGSFCPSRACTLSHGRHRKRKPVPTVTENCSVCPIKLEKPLVFFFFIFQISWVLWLNTEALEAGHALSY